MDKAIDQLQTLIKEVGLKVTPQRLAILDAIFKLNNHPTAENIIAHVRKKNPGIASGTVYKVLDVLVGNKIIKKIKTEKDIMRYDGMMENHHHLYCSDCDIIEDYVDEELDKILKNHFAKKNIPGFQLEDIIVQVKGKFKKC